MTISADMPAARGGAVPLGLSAAPEARTAPLSGVHIGALDGIRGIAILLVLAYHFGRSAQGFGLDSPVLWPTSFGWVGVDLFFVLSGFLITGILYDSRREHLYFRNFYARRALRIFPLYYGALLLVVLLGAAWPEAGVWGTESPIWLALYMTNLLVATEGPESAGILGHYWSLAIEEHFYLLWPLLVRWGTRRQLMAAAATLMVAALALRTVLVLGGADPEAVYIMTPTRIDALAAGAFCSLAVRGPAGPAGLVWPAWAVLLLCGGSVLLLIATQRTLGNHDPLMQTIGYTLLALTFAGAIVVGITGRMVKAVLENGVLRWFGRYSYGLYVWHPIVAVILFYTPLTASFGVDGKASAALFVLFAFAVSVLVSLVSYHCWEQPFLRLKRHFA